MKLIENFAKDWNNNSLPLTEIIKPKKIVEAEGQEYKVNKAYEVPIWKLGEKNLNNRIYSRELGEKVVKESTKTFALKDHPDDDGSVERIVAVAENPHIKENILYADAYFVDEEFEKKVEKIIERGMGLGVSSSALGDLDEYGNVMIEGFQIERYFDFVINPSYQVYLTKEGIKESENNTTNIEGKEDKFITTNILKDTKKENKMADKKDKTLSIEEKNLRLGVKNLFEKAENKQELEEKVSAYQEVIEYCDGVEIAEDYVQEANSKIKEIQKEIFELANKGKKFDEVNESKESSEKTLTEKSKELTSLKEDHEILAEKYDRAVELLEKMKDREKKLKELYEVAIAERNGMVEASEYAELQVYSEAKEKEIDELTEEIVTLKKKIRKMIEAKVESSKSRKFEMKKNKEEEDDEEEMDPEEEKGDVEEEEEDEPKEEKKKKKESFFDFGNSAEINRYYEDLCEQNHNVSKIKKEILGCKTLLEAQRKYLTLRDLVEDNFIPSSYTKMGIQEENFTSKSNNKIKTNIREGWL